MWARMETSPPRIALAPARKGPDTSILLAHYCRVPHSHESCEANHIRRILHHNTSTPREQNPKMASLGYRSPTSPRRLLSSKRGSFSSFRQVFGFENHSQSLYPVDKIWRIPITAKRGRQRFDLLCYFGSMRSGVLAEQSQMLGSMVELDFQHCNLFFRKDKICHLSYCLPESLQTGRPPRLLETEDMP